MLQRDNPGASHSIVLLQRDKPKDQHQSTLLWCEEIFLVIKFHCLMIQSDKYLRYSLNSLGMQAHIWLVNSSSNYMNWSQLLSDWSSLALMSLVGPCFYRIGRSVPASHFTLVLDYIYNADPSSYFIIHISPAPALIGQSQLLSHWSVTASLAGALQAGPSLYSLVSFISYQIVFSIGALAWQMQNI